MITTNKLKPNTIENHIISKLSQDVWIFGILEFLSVLDVVFGFGRTCKLVRYEIANEWLVRKTQKLQMNTSSSKTSSGSTSFHNSQVTWKILKAYKYQCNDLDEEEELNGLLIDLIQPAFLKYCLRNYILDLVLKFHCQWTQAGIIEAANGDTVNNSSTNCVIDSSNSYARIFTQEMECLQFYFSHFTQCVPKEEDTANSEKLSLVHQLFSHKNQISDPSDHVEIVKSLIIGDGGVGKTTFCKSLSSSNFDPYRKYIPTIGVETHNYRFNMAPMSNKPQGVNTHHSIKMSLWDTAGPERFGSLRDGYYLNAKYAIITFDLTSRCTYKNIPTWIRNVRRVCPQCEIIIVGTKSDLQCKISTKALHHFLSRKFFPYFESSSKVVPQHNLALPWYFSFLDACVASFVKKTIN
ncbi:hypothetical protein C9374_011668 [Naegleria lovaniensis]|uniref:Uncharacterized protein n=1 Tax=Naegleria lovaniensis TaxID=51637 RepID=A0AA88GF21_NAELO|nr:uncharacterized protein C9374_011668 [Naegleria lovaniensis]KAG2374003.1 hypothetical protein C9374_011668 [Naegleria lovaniensis]